MAVDPSGQKSSDRIGASGSATAPAAATETETGRSLIALTPVAPPRQTMALYRQAPFLAQLLAAKDRHPQTCARRRAAPQEAIAAYRDAAKMMR
jgi:hypothetical protein